MGHTIGPHHILLASVSIAKLAANVLLKNKTGNFKLVTHCFVMRKGRAVFRDGSGKKPLPQQLRRAGYLVEGFEVPRVE